MAVSALQPPASARAEDAAGEWKPNGESEGIRLFVREIEGTPLVAVRGEAEIDAPPGRIAHVILDCSRTHEWVDNLEECRWLRKVSETEYVTYNHFGTPFVMKDRDFVTRILIDVDAAKKTLALNFKAVEDPAMPETRYVRGEVVFSRYVLTALGDGSRTRLTGEVLADPKGTVPKWIVNIFQRKWPLKTLKSLRRQVAKKDIVTPAFFLDPFAKGKSP
jgi:hypothetical protein